MRAYLCIQCVDHEGAVGDFLYAGEKPSDYPPLSPVFDNLAPLFAWLQENGWHRTSYDPDHPVGVYEKMGS